MEKYLGSIVFVSLASILYLRTSRYARKLNANTKSSSLHSYKESIDAVNHKNSVTITILFGTCTGTSKKFSLSFKNKLLKQLNLSDASVLVKDTDNFDDSDFEKPNNIVLLICSTWLDGKPPVKAERLYSWLQDYSTDFRVSKNHLEHLQYSVFGLGAKIYESNFCKAVYEMDEYLASLGACRLRNIVCGDDASDLEAQFELWTNDLVMLMSAYLNDDKSVEVPSTAAGDVSNDTGIQMSKTMMKKLKQKERKKLNGTASSYPKQGLSSASTPSTVNNSSSTCCKNNNNSADAIPNSSTEKCCNSHDDKEVRAKAQEVDEEEDAAHAEWEEEDIINSNFVTMELLSDDEEEEEDDDDDDDGGKGVSDTVGGCGEGDESQVDVEDLGSAISRNHKNGGGSIAAAAAEITSNTPYVKIKGKSRQNVGNDHLTSTALTTTTTTEREMVTKLQRKALNKEGYKIIGSHSAVKLCRWTKNQMRGRGGCYKHTFYNITSYQCMEATPSLACANKCVFCWRHHKNPVGTEWRWKTDEPLRIVDEAVSLHQAMINEFKGVPGVLPERLIEGYTVRHCALSLVGEPIMYPRINEMIRELHRRKISTFMVTNAQFPERIRQLEPVTQFYVSVDSSTKDSLKAIDRPLFRDFWERFIDSLKEVRHKKQRTVYRMTLVKDWNMDSLDSYVELIELGQPDFIEIKAMTYCGKSDASTLTMQNVPWHREVCNYGELISMRLKERQKGPAYSIATEHEHSCCILLAREDKFKISNEWYTWIDYEKFHELMQRYYDSNGATSFTSEDYMLKTPAWALYKSETHGFDPVENRWKRNSAGAIVEIEYKSSESGCG